MNASILNDCSCPRVWNKETMFLNISFGMLLKNVSNLISMPLTIYGFTKGESQVSSYFVCLLSKILEEITNLGS